MEYILSIQKPNLIPFNEKVILSSASKFFFHKFIKSEISRLKNKQLVKAWSGLSQRIESAPPLPGAHLTAFLTFVFSIFLRKNFSKIFGLIFWSNFGNYANRFQNSWRIISICKYQTSLTRRFGAAVDSNIFFAQWFLTPVFCTVSMILSKWFATTTKMYR